MSGKTGSWRPKPVIVRRHGRLLRGDMLALRVRQNHAGFPSRRIPSKMKLRSLFIDAESLAAYISNIFSIQLVRRPNKKIDIKCYIFYRVPGYGKALPCTRSTSSD